MPRNDKFNWYANKEKCSVLTPSNIDLRAIMVAVDYDDLLAITLPWNRHHFKEVMVVTGTRLQDEMTAQIGIRHECRLFQTDLFWQGDAKFNKWLALETALDVFGREGWLCIMDADVLWPKKLPDSCFQYLVPGRLLSPLRRMWANWPSTPIGYNDSWKKWQPTYHLKLTHPYSVPHEDDWNKFPVHRNITEWAGYTQIFHASDPVLGEPPWHQVDWKHGGGADSFFQEKWKPDNKVRTNFEVLHLGPAGVNWMGRASPLVDGTLPEGSKEKQEAVAQIWQNRRGKQGEARFEGEKL